MKKPQWCPFLMGICGVSIIMLFASHIEARTFELASVQYEYLPPTSPGEPVEGTALENTEIQISTIDLKFQMPMIFEKDKDKQEKETVLRKRLGLLSRLGLSRTCTLNYMADSPSYVDLKPTSVIKKLRSLK